MHSLIKLSVAPSVKRPSIPCSALSHLCLELSCAVLCRERQLVHQNLESLPLPLWCQEIQICPVISFAKDPLYLSAFCLLYYDALICVSSFCKLGIASISNANSGFLLDLPYFFFYLYFIVSRIRGSNSGKIDGKEKICKCWAVEILLRSISKSVFLFLFLAGPISKK